jgi:hypothetical protein
MESYPMQLKKCVMVIDADLPLGLIANTAAVLSLTLGKSVEGILGPDIYDASGNCHLGITTIPIPILKGTKENLREIRLKIIAMGLSDLLDFTDAAQTTKTYQDYTDKISKIQFENLQYLGIALYGDKQDVTKLTGNLPLMR